MCGTSDIQSIASVKRVFRSPLVKSVVIFVNFNVGLKSFVLCSAKGWLFTISICFFFSVNVCLVTRGYSLTPVCINL